MIIQNGHWHGKKYYFGLHYDLHAGRGDTELGMRCGRRELVSLLKLVNPDFVQTDCKGHPGYTSWFSRTKDASIPPKLKKDALRGWRAATRELGLPLHCHYSGIWDKAAGTRHPDWCVRGPTGKATGAPFGANAGKATGEKMCPRGPYVDKLMIPQLLELIDRYQVDGFWIDGDLWAVEPCYCARCRKAFRKATGIARPPEKEDDPDWSAWWNFTRESYEAYVTRYCDAVHAHKPGVLVCSNWLQTFQNPGAPAVPTDWISGDNAWVWGLDASRCEARFLSTRGKPWDIMLWAFYCSHGMGEADSPWTMKPTAMLQQEAAALIMFGGQVQVYEHPAGLRDGRLIPWRARRIGEVGRFVRQRRVVCQATETVPQVAVLHSEHHVHATAKGKNLMWSVDTAPVRGATFAMLEAHYGVDILDEWALLPRLKEFPAVVAPEQDSMSDEMVRALRRWVTDGGKLLLSGAKAYERFGGEFLGVTSVKVEAKQTYHVSAGEGAVGLYSDPWRLVKPRGGARSLGTVGNCDLRDDRLLPYAAATLHRVGTGTVAYIPSGVFRDFFRNRYPLTREFIGGVARRLIGRLPVRVEAPTCIDVAMRRKGNRIIVHLLNRASGIPNNPSNGAIDEIPPVGPVRIMIRSSAKPKAVRAVFEKTGINWSHRKGETCIRVANVRIHAAVVMEGAVTEM